LQSWAPVQSVRPTPRSLEYPDYVDTSFWNAGKSSLVLQYIENHFVESYYPTIEATFNKSINYKGVEYECDIIDTAGQVCTTPSPPETPNSDR
jgi:hypothetical protein